MAEKEKRERPWKHQWLDLVEERSGLPAPTRHLLLSLGRRMDSDGGRCYPGTQTIASRTRLSERTVCTHLTLAETEGWLKRMPRGRAAGRAWRGHQYRPAVPGEVLKEIQYVITSGAEGDSVPQPVGTEPHDIGVLKEVQSSSSKSSPTTSERIIEERSRYSSEQLRVIDSAIEAFRTTRKTTRLADSVILTEFRRWKDYPVDRVVEGLRALRRQRLCRQGQGREIRPWHHPKL